MKIELIVTMAGAGFVWTNGTILGLPESEARSLIAAGYALEVLEEKPNPDPAIKEVKHAVTPKRKIEKR
jgi:hypothetical protein